MTPASPTPMPTFNTWRPKRLVEHGDHQISVATRLLVSYGAKLDQSKRDHAQSLLDHAKDVRHTLNNKYLLARIKPARLYTRKASEALNTIKGRAGSLVCIL